MSEKENQINYVVENPSRFKAILYRILMNTKKEITFLIHDKYAMILLLLLPVTLVLTVHFSTGGNGSENGSEGDYSRLQSPIIGILDRDKSVGYDGADLSEEMVNIYKNYQDKEEVELYSNLNETQLEEKLGLGEINAYIIINDGFEYNLSTKFVAYFQLVIDAYNQLILFDVESLVEECTEVFKEKFNFSGAISQDISYVNIPDQAARLFQISPFFYPMILFSMACLVNSQSIVGDVPKDRMVLTPASKGELLLGKLFGSIVVNSLMVFALFLLSLSLGMLIRGDLFIFLFIMWTCALVGNAMGLLISSISKSSLAAFQLFILSFITQAILILFIDQKIILVLFPIWTTMQLIMEVSMQGIGLFESGFGLPFITVLWLEFLIFTLISYIAYKIKRNLL